MKLPTVTIKHPTAGRMIINESDYDPTAHVLWGDERGPVDPPAAPEPGPDPVYWLEQAGTWWSIMGPEGKVGRSHRSERDARDALAGLIADDYAA